MRRLLYIPIIHSGPDLGSAGAAVAQTSAALAGEQRWAMHQKTVERFWDQVAAFLYSFDPRLSRPGRDLLTVYQDGLATDGEAGRRIVEEAARRGSRNYQVVRELLQRGAQLRKTEDPVLLLQEHENLLALAQQAPSTELYRSRRDLLMEQRDKFIAQNVNATLKEGELGVLFIGAYHSIAARLDADISVHLVKDPQRLRDYFQELFSDRNDKRLAVLARYLTAPIARSAAGA